MITSEALERARRVRAAERTRAVLVHYGDPELTLRAIASVREGSPPPGLIVVVDNSPTPLPAVPDDVVPVVVIRPGRNTGFAGGVTIGIEAAADRAWDYVWLLNNDAVAAKDTLDELLAAMARADGRALVSSQIRDETTEEPWFEQARFLPWRMESRGRRHRSVENDLVETRRPSWRTVYYLTGCSLLIPRQALTAIGGLDTSFFMYAEDVDLSMRCQRAGYDLVVTRRSVVRHRTSSASHLKGRERMVSEASLRLTRKHYPWLLPVALLGAAATALKRIVATRQPWWLTERCKGYWDAVSPGRRK